MHYELRTLHLTRLDPDEKLLLIFFSPLTQYFSSVTRERDQNGGFKPAKLTLKHDFSKLIAKRAWMF